MRGLSFERRNSGSLKGSLFFREILVSIFKYGDGMGESIFIAAIVFFIIILVNYSATSTTESG